MPAATLLWRDHPEHRQLEHNSPRLDNGHPLLRRALAGSHPGLCRLSGHRLVREDVHPHLSTPLDLPRHSDTRRLYLAAGDPGTIKRLEAIFTELNGSLTSGISLHATSVLLAVFYSLW